MRRQDKIIVIGGVVGVVVGVVVGIALAKRTERAHSEPVTVGRPDGRKLAKLGMALVGLVRLIEEL